MSETAPVSNGMKSNGNHTDVKPDKVFTISETERKGEGTKEKEEEKGDRCGWGGWRPQGLQRLRSPGCFLVFICLAGGVQGMVVSGFVSVVISSIERRFQFSSTETGLIASLYDIASILLMGPVVYLGGRGRKPLYVGVGMVVIALGSILFSLPHFTTGLYGTEQGDTSFLCQTEGGRNSSASCSDSGAESLADYKYVFYLAQLLHGAGTTPLYVFGTVYLDENLPVRSVALYHGFFYSCATLGPGIGYLIGSGLLTMYTDFDQVDAGSVDLKQDNPRWVGAWWLGFLLSAVLSILIALPLICFPKRLPGQEKYREDREREVYRGKSMEGDGEGQKKQKLGLKHLLTSIKLLATNPTYMFLNLAAASESFLLGGFSAFAPKYIEFQFNVTSATAGLIVGVLALVVGGSCILIGGYVVKRFNMGMRAILKFSLLWTFFFAVCCSLVFMVHCGDQPFAGISKPYTQSDGSDSITLKGSCNTDCQCSDMLYKPVCGRDNVMYYSPCHAGCNTSLGYDGTIKQYGNCSCVAFNWTAQDVQEGESWAVQEGPCESDCSHLPLFVAFFSLIWVGVFIPSMPGLSASLRGVSQDLRSLSLGIQTIIIRLLGFIPGPIVFGAVIDMTCRQWQQSCEGNGACMYYNNKQLSNGLLAMTLACNCVSALSFLLALCTYKAGRPDDPPKHVKPQVNEGYTDDNDNFGLNGTYVKVKEIPARDVSGL